MVNAIEPPVFRVLGYPAIPGGKNGGKTMKHKGTRNLAILLALALLFALVPGMSLKAYADNTETLLTTITATAKEQASYNPENVATVSFSYTAGGSSAYMNNGKTNWGWWGYGWTATVNAADGYTITKCVFYDDKDRTATDSEAPFLVETTEEDKTPKVNGTPILAYQSKGITKIEVYGYAAPATVAVTSITLDQSTASMTLGGGTLTLTPTVLPDNATDKSVSWSSDNTAVATVDTNGLVTAVAPGTANITVTTTDGNKQATCAVTVNNPTISINPGVNNGTYDGNGVYKVTYDGNPHYVTVYVTTPASATVKYGTASDKCALDASPTITDVGSLTVYYTVTADGYTTLYGNATVTVNRAEQTAPAAPTAESVTVSSVTLVAIENGEYSMDGTNWQTSPSFTGLTMNTGYTFYQRLKADGNHNASPASSAANISTSSHAHNWSYEASGATVTATCANTDGGHESSTTATLTINAPAHSVYGDGQSAEATVTGSIDGVTTPAIVYKKGADTLSAAPTDAGTYTANITLGDATASVAYTVNKVNISPIVSISGWTYGQTAGTPNVSGNTGSGTVTYSYAAKGSTDFSAAVPTNAGDYIVKAKVDATNNYNGGETTADFTIAKASVTVTAEAKSKTYGEADPALTYSASGLVGSDTLTGALTREAGENAGTYAITQGSLTAGDNYTIRFTGASFTINKAAITITADDKSSRYGDELAALTYTVGGAYKAGDELNVTLNTAASPTANVGEYEITVAYNNANYDATLVKGKYTITKTGLTVTAAGYTGSYDGNPHGITVDVGSSGATVYYAATELTAENYAAAGSTTAPTYTDAGENTVYFYVVSGNYDPDVVSGSKTVIITTATGTATDAQKPTAKMDLVADNTDQAFVTAPSSLPEGYTKVQYSLNGETWTDEIPTGKDAGSYTVNYKYVGDSNHNDFQGEPFTVTIKTLTVSFEVNGGSTVAAQSIVKGEKLARPADPSKSGNAFDGWYQDATFAKAFDFETPITADVTLYAKWTPNDYTLTAITGTTSDANHVWYKDSNVNVVLTAKLATEPDNSFAHYVRTEIDGTPVAAAAREGSTVVTLAPTDLQRLSVGAHTVSIVFDNGRVDIRLTVRQPSNTPSTGDQSHTALYLTVLAVSALGMAALTGETKKRRSVKH